MPRSVDSLFPVFFYEKASLVTALDQTIADAQGDLQALVGELRGREAASAKLETVRVQRLPEGAWWPAGHVYVALLAALIFFWSTTALL